MELEKQLVSLELSKRLKELGVKQDNIFCWITTADDTITRTNRVVNPNLYTEIMTTEKAEMCTYEILCSAFGVSELGEMLPVEITDTNGHYYLWYRKINSKEWYVSYSHRRNELCLSEEVEDTLADAMAKMLIYLIENNYIEVEKL